MTKTDLTSHDVKTHRIEKKMHFKKHSTRNKKGIIPFVQQSLMENKINVFLTLTLPVALSFISMLEVMASY